MPDIQHILKIQKKQQRYIIDVNLPQQQLAEEDDDDSGLAENSIWIVVKSLIQDDGSQGHVMQEKDQIKLGRVRFRIREIKILEIDYDQNNLVKIISSNKLQFKKLDICSKNTFDFDDARSSISDPNAQICRICLGEAEFENPLLDPCLCQGSVKFIHLQCLQKWLSNKLGVKMTKFSVSFVWKKFECEICKAPLPNVIEYNGKCLETVVIPKPQVPYIALEILSRDKNISKGIDELIQQVYHKKVAQNQEEAMIRMLEQLIFQYQDFMQRQNQLTVIYFKVYIIQDGFLLEDNRSKFGTLVLLKKQTNISLDENNNIAFQIGRSVISFQIKKDWKVGSCCMGSNISNQEADRDADEVQKIGIGDQDSILMSKQKKPHIVFPQLFIVEEGELKDDEVRDLHENDQHQNEIEQEQDALSLEGHNSRNSDPENENEEQLNQFDDANERIQVISDVNVVE